MRLHALNHNLGPALRAYRSCVETARSTRGTAIGVRVYLLR